MVSVIRDVFLLVVSGKVLQVLVIVFSEMPNLRVIVGYDYNIKVVVGYGMVKNAFKVFDEHENLEQNPKVVHGVVFKLAVKIDLREVSD